jgi:C6 transcription factor Pro1
MWNIPSKSISSTTEPAPYNTESHRLLSYCVTDVILVKNIALRRLASISMSGPLRSKQGCWTCRLRKKKCDEGRPHCSTCESLSITCYGFGPKPDWMNDGEKERAVANSLIEIVKHTPRRKSKTQFPKQRNPIIRIAPKSSNGPVENSSSGPRSSRQHGVTTPLDHGSSQED